MREFYDTVGTDSSEPYPLCKGKTCKRRIVPCDSELDLTLLCPNCFEHYVATEEEILAHADMLARYDKLRKRREETKAKYGRNSKSYDAYEGWCQPKQC